MTVVAQHAAPQPLEDPRTVQRLLRTAVFSVSPEVLDDLARREAIGEVLRKIAHNPVAAAGTLEHLVDLDQRYLAFPVTRRRGLSPEFIDRIARRLTDRHAIYHASSAPNATPETLRDLAGHPLAPAATRETVTRRLGAENLTAV